MEQSISGSRACRFRALLAAFLLLLPGLAAAAGGGKSGGDLDPHRGMSFRAPPRPGSVGMSADPSRLLLESRATRSEVDPHRSFLQNDVYSLRTGRIEGSLSDRVKKMRQGESRKR